MSDWPSTYESIEEINAASNRLRNVLDRLRTKLSPTDVYPTVLAELDELHALAVDVNHTAILELQLMEGK